MDIRLLSDIFGGATLLLQIAGGGLLLALFVPRSSFGKMVRQMVRENVLGLGLLLALSGMLGSLFLSNVVGLAPCTLCWWQRIFLYPQVVLFGTALLYKEGRRALYDAALALSIGGLGVSIYQYIIQKSGGEGSVFCDVSTGVSCAKQYMNAFGYITIPMMALTTFAVLIMILLLARKS
jgi:disulfide bond formation protein DsbB